MPFSTRVTQVHAFCLVECHSRKLFVEFTHSHSFETFVQSQGLVGMAERTHPAAGLSQQILSPSSAPLLH